MGLMSRMGWVRSTPNTPASSLLINDPDGWVSDQDGPAWWISGDSWPSWTGSGSGGSNLPAVVRCHNLIVDSIASMPLRQIRNGEAVQPTPRWLTDPMLLRPDDRFGVNLAGRPGVLSGPEFYAALISSVVMRGNGFFLYQVDQSTMPMPALLPLAAEHVGTTVDASGSKVYTIGGQPLNAAGRLDLNGTEWSLFHTRGPAPYDEDGFGLGVLDRHAQTIADGRTFRSFAETSVQSGVPAGYLKVTTPSLTQSQADELKSKWMAAHGSSRRSIAVLNAVTDFTPLSITPVDAAVVEMLKMNAADIALAFGVEPAMIGAGSDPNTYANVESRMLQFVQFTLLPYIRRLEVALSALVPAGTDVRIDMRGLLRADTSTRVATYSTALADGWMTVNEVRGLEDLPPLAEPAAMEEVSDETA